MLLGAAALRQHSGGRSGKRLLEQAQRSCDEGEVKVPVHRKAHAAHVFGVGARLVRRDAD